MNKNPMRKSIYLIAIALLVILLGIINFSYDPQVANSAPEAYYQHRAIHSRDGIGKFYLGREIAKVMGYQEMLWLERPSREQQELPGQVIEALELQPTDIVTDIGAGTGYFAFRLAKVVNQGKVLAVDVQPEMIDAMDFLATENEVNNVETILGTVKDPQLPSESIDLALMVDAYHEFAYPREMMEGIFQGLKTGGRVVLLEYRLENPLIPIKGLHKMSQKQVKKEMAAVGLVWDDTKDFLPQQHLMIFRKPGD